MVPIFIFLDAIILFFAGFTGNQLRVSCDPCESTICKDGEIKANLAIKMTERFFD